MAKRMARLNNGVVINIEWCADRATETDTLKDPAGRAVAVGDTYEDGKFYREGVQVLTPLEEAYLEIMDMRTALNKLGVTLDE